MKELHKQIATLVIATFVLFTLPSAIPIHAAETNTSSLSASLSELLVLNMVEDLKPLPKDETYLSLKVKLVSTAKTALTFPLSNN